MTKNTRQRLIDATYEEMYTNGYQGVALDKILKEAGVHKGSMYHFFKNKKEMALAAIKEKMDERIKNTYVSGVSDTPPYLPQWFKILHDTNLRDFKRGCPIANLVQEMSNLDEDFNKTLERIYFNFRDGFKSVYEKAINSGELKECNTDKLALFSMTVIEGAILAAKASGNPQDYLDAIDMLEEYVMQFKA